MTTAAVGLWRTYLESACSANSAPIRRRLRDAKTNSCRRKDSWSSTAKLAAPSPIAAAKVLSAQRFLLDVLSVFKGIQVYEQTGCRNFSLKFVNKGWKSVVGQTSQFKSLYVFLLSMFKFSDKRHRETRRVPRGRPLIIA